MKTKTLLSGKETTGRRPRLRRAHPDHLPAFRLTERDGKVVYDVYVYGALSSRHIEVLHFGGSLSSQRPVKSQCRYRLQLLYQHGFLERSGQYQLPGEGMLPFVYRLDRRGAQYVADRLGCSLADLDWQPPERMSHLYQEHLLSTNDVRIAITLSAKKHGFVIPTWWDERTLRSQQMKDYVLIQGPEGGERKMAVIPDGFFTLEVGHRKGNLFLEVDLATVTGESSIWERRTYGRKMAAYLAYYRSGQYQKRYQSQSMRVLTVTTGDKRLANLKAVTEGVGGKSRFWFATFSAIKERDVLTDPIWQVAGRDGLFSLVEKSEEAS